MATILFMLAAAVTGAADYTDTDGTARARATLHSTLMVVALLLLLISLALRAGAPADRTIPIALSLIGFLIVTAGAYVGGDVVYVFGNMVSRHAFRGAGTKWIKLDTGDVTRPRDAPRGNADQGQGRDQRPRPGPGRRHDPRLHAVCAHAGGPLAQGTFVDGCVECPWHGSRFRVTDGHVRRGPAAVRPAGLRDPRRRGRRLRGPPRHDLG